MRHYCSNCSSEFFDDAPSSSPAVRVFCVFCGSPLPSTGDERPRAPFSDASRNDGSALGVLGRPSSEFPETLRPFPVGQRNDSLSPLQTEPEPPDAAEPWRPSRFWLSLAVGFGVGAAIAALLAQRETSHPPAPNPRAALSPPPAVALSAGCPATSAPSPAAVTAPPTPSATPSPAPKPHVTPALERRFWLERARTAQRDYRLPDAERFFRRVLALSPQDSEALTGMGELELLRGAPLAAGARFQEALASNANYLPALIALADLHWQAGEIEAARDAYRNVVEHFAEDLYPPYVKQRLDDVNCVPQCVDVRRE